MPSPSNRLHRNQNKFLIDLIGKDLKDFSPAETALLVIFTVLVMAIIHFVINRLLKFLSGVREHDTDGSFKSAKDLKNGTRKKSTKKKKKIYYELPLPLLSASKIQEKLDENIKNKIQPTWRVENIKETQSHLALHDKNKTVEWVPKSKKFAWCPVESNLLLMLPSPSQQNQHEQEDQEEENDEEERIVEFDIGDLQRGQIGVGFMLVFDESQHGEHDENNDINDDEGKDNRQSTKNSNSSHFGIPVSVDWGFFGYLGSSKHAWSYDPSTGDVVTATESIEGGLPKLSNVGGKVRLIFNTSSASSDDVEEQGYCYAQFEIEGKRSKKIPLPQSEDEEGSVVVMIAACLLKQGQRVTLNLIK